MPDSFLLNPIYKQGGGGVEWRMREMKLSFAKYVLAKLAYVRKNVTSMAPPASGSLLEITVEKCSPYSRYTRNICKIGYTFCAIFPLAQL